MPTAAIPFINQQATGYEVLAGAGAEAFNVISVNGTLRRRPGLAAFSGISNAVVDASGLSALHVTKTGAVYAVSAAGAERSIYRVTGSGAAALSGGVPPGGLRGTRRPIIVETELLLVLAGGSDMQKVELATDTSTRLAGSPPTSSHVIANADRLLANDLVTSPTNVRYSDVASGNTSYAGHESWTLGVGTAGFFSKEAKPDPIVALGENSNEVFAFGSLSTAIFQPDPTTKYALVANREFGCSAPYSLIKVDDAFFLFDNFGRFVRTDGRGFDVISDPIQKTLDDIAVKSDCFGYRVTEGALDALVWTFPSDGRSFVYQRESGWAQWAAWNTGTNNWTRLEVAASVPAPTDGTAVIATTDGRIGRYALDSRRDLTEIVQAQVATGYGNRGTDSLKFCRCVYVSIERGVGANAVSFDLYFRDRPGPWTRIPVSLGASGDTEIVVPLRGLGTYRRRQWKFGFSGDANLSLVGVTEDYDVLGV
jgi:hypothetical protein